jgi:hypothetical protein
MAGFAKEAIDFVGFGDFTKERHEMPEPLEEEFDAELLRLQAENPERLKAVPVKWAD